MEGFLLPSLVCLVAVHAARYRRLLEALRDGRLDPARHRAAPLLSLDRDG